MAGRVDQWFDRLVRSESTELAGRGRPAGRPRIASQGGGRARVSGEAASQFMLFALSKEREGPAILKAADVQPELQGSVNESDVQLAASMQCFHVGTNENVDPETRATLRINIGQDPANPSTTQLDTLFWSIAAGLQLFDEQAKARPCRTI